MDFESAIQAHSNWKMKLKNYLAKPDGSIDVNQLSKDNVCPLGCWLHGGESQKFKHLEDFKKLMTSHGAFHKAAADIVRRKDRGEEIAADIALGGDAPFSKYSKEVVSLLMSLKRQM